MQAYRPDRVVRVLSALATGVYWLTWVFTVLMLVAIPVARVMSVRDHDATSSWGIEFGIDEVGVNRSADVRFRMAAPVTLAPPRLGVPAWRSSTGSRLQAMQVQATASVPMSLLSTRFVALVWCALAVFLGLVLLFLENLRRLFRRLRQGAPFDPANVARLRRLGLLLLSASLWKSVTDFWMALVLTRTMAGPGDAPAVGITMKTASIVVALVLLALAEIFRRGAALEDEQALVV